MSEMYTYTIRSGYDGHLFGLVDSTEVRVFINDAQHYRVQYVNNYRCSKQKNTCVGGKPAG